MSPPPHGDDEEVDLDRSYRLHHEQFVSGHNGTTVTEIVSAGATVNLALLLFSLASVVLAKSPRYSDIFSAK